MINEERLAQALLAAFQTMAQQTQDPAASARQAARDLAAAIATELRQAQPYFPPGAVQVVGSAGPSSNPTPLLGSLQ